MMIEQECISFDELKAIQKKEGWIGVAAYIFERLHTGAFKTMSDAQLKELLVEIGSNEDSKDALILFELIVKLEEDYREKGRLNDTRK